MAFLQTNAKRVVVKIGTNSLTDAEGLLLTNRIQALCRQIAHLQAAGLQVLVVSSGAVGMGLGKLALKNRPDDLPTLQACAAVGQSRLMEAWQSALEAHSIVAAQVLLTREDIRGRRRHLAVRSSLEKLLSMGVVPVVNENDTVSTDEIKFGDNDVLSALLASLLMADLLVILSTTRGLMADKGNGALIPVVEQINDHIRNMAGGSLNEKSTGGMVTKIEAAELATHSGCGVFIASAEEENILGKIHSGEAEGTFFVPQALPLVARKRWIAFFENPTGRLHLDSGAVEAVIDRHSSLLAKGLTACEGNFSEGDVLTLHDPEGHIIGRGVVAFEANILKTLIGKPSSEIQKLVPSRKRYEVVHRDSLVLTGHS